MDALEERNCWYCKKTLCYTGAGIISTMSNGVKMEVATESSAIFICKCGKMNTISAGKKAEVVKG